MFSWMIAPDLIENAVALTRAAEATPKARSAVIRNKGQGAFTITPAAAASTPETVLVSRPMVEADCSTGVMTNQAKQACPVDEGSPFATKGHSMATVTMGSSLQTQRSAHGLADYGLRPRSGDELFAFRRAALHAGQLYTRTFPEKYVNQWRQPAIRPTYQQWKELLARESAVIARSQSNNRLTILVGDSLFLWLPMEQLPRDRFWLNQSISGETTSQILSRLYYFAETRPTQIHIMAGINDLKNGASDQELIQNTHDILYHLRRQHPDTQLMIYSILPTRLPHLPSDRIRRINQYIAYMASRQGATYIDLQSTFSDRQGLLRQDLTTDGLHLSVRGYDVWQTTLVNM